MSTAALPKKQTRGKLKPISRGKSSVSLLIGTIKGAFILRGGKSRASWKIEGPIMLGATIDHIMRDPRDNRTLLMGARTGHLGPTVFRSTDGGKNWKEARKPPAFPKARGRAKKRSVDAVFWLTPGHSSEPRVWYAGTIPLGLFRSEDGGETWEGVAGLNSNPDLAKWSGGTPPGGPFTHSVLVDPRDANHLYISLSVGGFFESTNRGRTWKPLNKGCKADYLPDPDPEYGQDPHHTIMHPRNPDRFYQQNHCGIYRMDRAEGLWHRIGSNMPPKIGDIGFAIASHPRNPDMVWVFPMDGTQVWPRTSPQGRPAVYKSRDAGRSWERCDAGFPREHAYYTVFRNALSTDTRNPVGIYLGTTSGEVWASTDEGENWRCLASHLPRILSVEAIEDP